MHFSKISSKKLTLTAVLLLSLVFTITVGKAQVSVNPNNAATPIMAKIAEVQNALLAKTEEVRNLDSRISATYGTDRETWKHTSKLRSALSDAESELAAIEKELERWEMILDRTLEKMEIEKEGTDGAKEKAYLALDYVPTTKEINETPAIGMAAK